MSLSRDKIVAAAIEVIDAAGVEKLTMRRLAAQVGVEPMSLYHHFPSKADLLDAIVDAATESYASHLTVAPAADWRDGLLAFGAGMRAALLAHPRLLPLVSTRPATPDTAESLGHPLLGPLVAAGFSRRRAEFAVQSVAVFVLGHAMAQAGSTPGAADVPNRSAVEAYYDEWFELGLTALVNGLAG
ncbi:TetR family transcriptional regulator [Fodinicola acaciae]|uniref:TetR family transcriptional regulator n=1 Tax=Fodinicola acaciae TaxID=2681555 RepID=UPI0013D2C774|nr:TetR family transcriptional regulator [Fodinicola acaciae]